MLVVFLHGCLGSCMLFVVVMFSCGCIAPVKNLAGQICSEMTYNVSRGSTQTQLRPVELQAGCSAANVSNML